VRYLAAPSFSLAVALAVLWNAAAGAQVRPPSPTPLPGAGLAGDARSRVVLDLDCSNVLGSSRVTWFANGTVRRKEVTGGERRMWLGELGPDEAAAYRARLRAEAAAAEAWNWPDNPVEGELVERCSLEWTAEDGQPARRHEFSRLATLPLALARILALSAEIAREADLEARLEGLPLDYVARPGDLLRRVDGTLFRVVAWTDDKRGIELSGVREPLTLYVLASELRVEFVALVEPERPLR
jgi:hypothetical protein